MKTIVLLRHAKSSRKDPHLQDIDRPLNKRGKKDAPEMGRRMAEKGIHPDAVITSPALRARVTAKAVAKALGVSKKGIVARDQIYMAGTEGLMSTIHELENEWDLVVLVGHNPDMTNLGNQLGGLDIANIPTCGALALEFDTSRWDEIQPGSGKELFFDFPKKEPENDS